MNKSIYITTFIFLFCSCLNTNKCSLEKIIINKCTEVDTLYSFPLIKLTEFDWDYLYVVIGPRFPDEVEEIVGVKYNEIIIDNSRHYIFIKDGDIFKEVVSRCNDLEFSNRVTEGKGFVKYSLFDVIDIRKREDEGVFYYDIVGLSDG